MDQKSPEKMSQKKISKIQEEGESSSKNGDNQDSAKPTTPIACPNCGKEFSSGKALGGHRRIHFQAFMKMDAQKNHHHHEPSSPSPSRMEPNYISIVNPHVIKFKILTNSCSSPHTPCPQHDAPRMKPNKKVNIFVDNSPNSVIESKNHITIGNGNGNGSVINYSSSSRCCVCEKDFPSEKSLYGHMRCHPEREWRGMNPPSTSEEQRHKEIRDNGVCSSSAACPSSIPLGFVDLTLSCAGCSWLKKDKRGKPSTSAIDVAETLVLLSQDKRHSFASPQNEDEVEAVQLPLKKRKKNNLSSSSTPSYWEEKLEDKLKKRKVQTMKTVKSKGEEQLRMINSVVKSLATPSQRYVCDICGKSFNCHQALGGHKSRHYEASRKKVKEVVVETKPEEASLTVISSNGNDEINMSIEEEKVKEAGQQCGASKMLDFDLNELYVPEIA